MCGPIAGAGAEPGGSASGSAIGLMVRERLTGEAPPEAAREGLALVSGWIEEKAGADLDALGLALDDQAAFAALATKLLRDLELIEGETDGNADPESGDEDSEDDKEGAAEEEGDDEDQGGGEAEIRGQQENAGDEAEESKWSEEEMSDSSDGLGEEGEEAYCPSARTAAFRPAAELRLSRVHWAYDEEV